MSSLVAKGPARRLLWRGNCRPQCPIPAESLQAFRGSEAAGTRLYATTRIFPASARAQQPGAPAPPRTPGAQPRHTGPPTKILSRLGFAITDVPSAREWTVHLEAMQCTDLTAVQCVEGATRYVRIVKNEERQERGEAEEKHNIPPRSLHWMGLALLSFNTPARYRLGTHMLRSASVLGFAPATLTLVRILTSLPPDVAAKAASMPAFQGAHDRFEQGLAQAPDPNALTLRGIMLAKAGDDRQALEMFGRAAKAWEAAHGKAKTTRDTKTASEPSSKAARASVAGPRKHNAKGGARDGAAAAAVEASGDFVLPPPREPKWEWELSNVLGQANILAKNPKAAAKTLELFRVAAVELDNAQGFLMLAKLMRAPRDSPERRVYVLKAAISGELEACREMGELENLAATKTTDTREKAEHGMLSKQWFQLAEGEDPSVHV